MISQQTASDCVIEIKNWCKNNKISIHFIEAEILIPEPDTIQGKVV